MPEYIEREALLSELMKGTIVSDDLYGMGIMSGVDFAMKKIVEQPAADVAPVVRCKDCKHWCARLGWCDKHSHFTDGGGEFCHPWESSEWKMFDADYFCKDGERKET